MTVRGLLIRPDRPERVAIRGIEDMQAAVGGWVEAIHLPYGTAYVDEDGRTKRLPYNVIGSLICGRDILGNVLVLGPLDGDGNDTDLDDDHVEEILRVGREAGKP